MWNVSTTSSLIEDLHNTPCLWDVQCADYKNRTKKDEAFEMLGKKYGVSSVDIEKKIQSLKNQFRREHRKFIDASRTGSHPRACRWFGYESLSFLLQVYESRGNRISLDDPDDAAEKYSDVCMQDDCDDDAGDEGTSDGISEGLSFDKQTPSFRPPFLKRKRSQEDSALNETFNCIRLLAESVSQRDEFSVYGEHIANKLKYSGRSRYEIAIAQRRIDEICFQLAMGSFSQRPQSSSIVDSQDAVQNSFTPFQRHLNSPGSGELPAHCVYDASPNPPVLARTITDDDDSTKSCSPIYPESITQEPPH